MTSRRAGWLALAVVLAVAMFVGVTEDRDPTTPTERAHNLSEQIACPVCDGQSVADSGVSAARGVRQYIDTRIADGASDDEIRDELALQFGDDVILTPDRTGLASLVWTLPVAVLVAALVGIGLAFRRWRSRADVRASAADRSLVERELQQLGER